MRTLRDLILKNATLLLHILVTVLLYVPCALFFKAFPDFILFSNVIYALLIVYFFYEMLFQKKYSGFFLRTICTIVLMTATNQWYSYEKIVKILPQVETISKSVLILLVVGVGVSLLVIFKLLSYMDAPASRPIERLSSNPTDDTFRHETAQTSSNQDERNIHQVGEPSYTWDDTKDAYMKNDFFPFLKFILCICVFVLAPAGLLYLFAHYGLDKKLLQFHELSSFLFSYGMLFLLVFMAFIFVGIILLSVYQYFSNVMKSIRNNAKKDTASTEYPLPPYLLSVVLVFIFFYYMRNGGLNEEFKLTLDTITDALVIGDYLAEPLAIIIGISLFILLVQLTYAAVLLLIKITPERISKLIHREEEKWGLIDKIVRIVKTIVVDIILGSLESTLKFVKFVPDFFESLSDLILYDDNADDNDDDMNEQEEKQKEENEREDVTNEEETEDGEEIK